MRVILVGNMNNNAFAIQRYLLSEGYDAHLFYLDEDPTHFRPSCDTFNDDYIKQSYSLDWSRLPSNIYSYDFSQQLQIDVQRNDFIIASGIGMAYLYKFGVTPDIFIPYGSDLYRLTNIRDYLKFKYFRKIHKLVYRSLIQQKAIASCDLTIMEYTNHRMERFVDRYVKKERINITPPMIYAKENWHQNVEENPHIQKLLEMADKGTFLVVQHIRQEWKVDSSDLAYKANDKLIYAFKQLLEGTPNAKLVLFEYGNSLADSKNLIIELDLENNVVWMPLMDRKYIMQILTICDIFVGELGRKWNTYGSMLEATLAGLPVIHFCDEFYFKSKNDKLYPEVVNAETIEELTNSLSKYAAKKELKRSLKTIRGRDWYDVTVVKPFLTLLITRIELKTKKLSAN